MDRRTFIGASATVASLSATGAAVAGGDNCNPPAEHQVQLDVSICFDSGALLSVPLRLPGAPAGLMHRPLRRLDNGTLRSAVVSIPAGWTSGSALTPRARLQFYVLSGQIDLGELTLGENGYAVLQPNKTMSRFGARSGAEVLLVCDGAPAFEPARDAAENVDAVIIPHVPTDRSTQLWKDPESGGTMAFLHFPAGWTNPGPEYHPCSEEIFSLSGDIAPDDIRINTRGWFLWNPPYGVHGFHLHSVAGGTVLEWHDGPWAKLIYQG